MEKFYTITSTKRLDGSDNYGNVTDSTYFEDEKDSALWRHAPDANVAKGTQVYGIIEELPTKAGGTYRKFTKKMLPEGMQRPSNAPQTAPKASTSGSYNGDGARQGMAINNAATYVTKVAGNSMLEPQELADEITRYAKAIYQIDLTKNTDQDILDMMSD